MQVNLNPTFKNVYWDFKSGEGEEIIIGENGISDNPEEKLAAGEKIELVVKEFNKKMITLGMKIPSFIPVYSGNLVFCEPSTPVLENVDFKISLLPEWYNFSWYSQMINQTSTAYWIEPKEIILGDKLSIYFHSIHGGKARLKFVAPKDIRFQSLKSDKT